MWLKQFKIDNTLVMNTLPNIFDKLKFTTDTDNLKKQIKKEVNKVPKSVLLKSSVQMYGTVNFYDILSIAKKWYIEIINGEHGDFKTALGLLGTAAVALYVAYIIGCIIGELLLRVLPEKQLKSFQRFYAKKRKSHCSKN